MMAEPARDSDYAFVERLGAAVDLYLRSVDVWEAAYQKYYRLPGYASRIGDDLEAEQRSYHARRRELEELLPRARRLCYRHKLREPFSGLLRISLGAYSPQERTDSAIGRSERNAVAVCLVELRTHTRAWESAGTAPEEPRERASLLQRLVNFFY